MSDLVDQWLGESSVVHRLDKHDTSERVHEEYVNKIDFKDREEAMRSHFFIAFWSFLAHGNTIVNPTVHQRLFYSTTKELNPLITQLINCCVELGTPESYTLRIQYAITSAEHGKSPSFIDRNYNGPWSRFILNGAMSRKRNKPWSAWYHTVLLGYWLKYPSLNLVCLSSSPIKPNGIMAYGLVMTRSPSPNSTRWPSSSHASIAAPSKGAWMTPA